MKVGDKLYLPFHHNCTIDSIDGEWVKLEWEDGQIWPEKVEYVEEASAHKSLTDQLVNLIINTDYIGTWNLDRKEIVKLAKKVKEKEL